MRIMAVARKIIYRHRADSDSYIRYLRKKGAKIGERVTIFEPHLTRIDDTRGYLIDIGDDVKITVGVTLLTHGYDWNVLSGVFHDVLGSSGHIKIGNNVFIGMHTTILKGVTVGNNVIIGANSLVNHDVPNNVVVAGNPAKVIMSLEDYHMKRVESQKQEAFEMYNAYLERFGVEPPESIFDEFFWLFTDRNDVLPECFERQMKWHDNYDVMLETFKNSYPAYSSFEEFKKAAAMNYKNCALRK